MRSFMICTAYQYYSGYQIKDNEMVWACGTYGEEEKYIQRFCLET
jgi:hypothetical protein